MVRTVLAVVASALIFSASARAAEDLASSGLLLPSRTTIAGRMTIDTPLVNTERAKATTFEESATPAMKRAPETRPRGLMSLYAGLVGLEAFDVVSTKTALDRGALEANPLMKGAVKNQPAFVAIKSGMTALTILGAETLWRRHHRFSAIALMTASNGFMAFVAANNTSVLAKLR